jgi:hypothetical protein
MCLKENKKKLKSIVAHLTQWIFATITTPEAKHVFARHQFVAGVMVTVLREFEAHTVVIVGL